MPDTGTTDSRRATTGMPRPAPLAATPPSTGCTATRLAYSGKQHGSRDSTQRRRRRDEPPPSPRRTRRATRPRRAGRGTAGDRPPSRRPDQPTTGSRWPPQPQPAAVGQPVLASRDRPKRARHESVAGRRLAAGTSSTLEHLRDTFRGTPSVEKASHEEAPRFAGLLQSG